MRAVAYEKPQDISSETALIDVELDQQRPDPVERVGAAAGGGVAGDQLPERWRRRLRGETNRQRQGGGCGQEGTASEDHIVPVIVRVKTRP